MSSRWLRNSFIYLLILVAVIAIVVSFFRDGSDTKSINFSEVVAEAKDGNIKSIEVSGQSLTVVKKDQPDETFKSRIGENTDLEQILRDENVDIGCASGVEIKYKSPGGFGNWIGILINFLPLLVF